ncbi:MAG: hypothetical protein K0R92_2093 [Lachnospiraceae bacterium]|nr:hypothetical protein [Lachnospiraceae bacterium]
MDFDLSLLLETDGMDIVSDSGDKLICIAVLLLLAVDNRKINGPSSKYVSNIDILYIIFHYNKVFCTGVFNKYVVK